jgi:hypothetical protein
VKNHWEPYFTDNLCIIIINIKSLDSSVGIVTGYGLDGQVVFLYPHSVQTGCGAHGPTLPHIEWVSGTSNAAETCSWPVT